ncbi:hypothetical protein [Psychromicrobium xiongbiense]|uniref:hypothetical protein n=1 Tax=Psychromicrobium xiongbiense TaxID=3051184 RepID=UPI0025545FB4|nr:hypothetical protein [Psychromicrobium sp. YIM S02556]
MAKASAGGADRPQVTAQEARFSAAAKGADRPGESAGYNAGITVFSYITGGILVWSLIGWGLDSLFKTHWIVLIGALAGALGGLYLSFAPRFRQGHVKGDVHSGTGSSQTGDGQE